jgi:phosphatidylethanolamine/phosphatidyl-N-methylethanolamine N-methyltransferase
MIDFSAEGKSMLSFISQAIKNTYHTGSVWPSSAALAREMTRSMRNADGPRRILEVGPGTGPFTKHILEALRSGDEFHAVEINAAFCKELEDKLFSPYREDNPGSSIHLHAKPIEETDVDGEFDFIICGLPFNNFPPADTRAIFKSLLGMLKPGAELVYFEYACVRGMRSAVVGPTGRKKIKQIDAHGKFMQRRFSGSRELVLANLPPAYAVRLQGVEQTVGN